MNAYSISLFLHIVGALGFFIALAMEWTGLLQIRSAITVEQALGWMGILKNVRKVGFVSMLTTVITGFYMFLVYWRGAAWLIVTIGSLVLVIVLAQVVTAPRMVAIGKALIAQKGLLSRTFYSPANHPLLSISIQTRAAIALGIVFLKVVKPNFGGSLLTISIAIVLGIVSALPVSRRELVQEKLAD